MPTAVRSASIPTGPPTGPPTRSNNSANILRPRRLRAWVIALEVGTDQAASQQPNLSSDPVTLVATSE